MSEQRPILERRLARVVTLPPAGPGQFGPAHTVVEVLGGESYGDTDPFILLMDDRIDGKPIGGPHPHAGFETVTLILEGGMVHDSGKLAPGDMQWMTAGSGVIHGEGLEGSSAGSGRARILQLWLTLPQVPKRWAPPGFQDQAYADLPVRREPGVEVRVYSGSSGGVRSKTLNHVPVTLVELLLEPGRAWPRSCPPPSMASSTSWRARSPSAPMPRRCDRARSAGWIGRSVTGRARSQSPARARAGRG